MFSDLMDKLAWLSLIALGILGVYWAIWVTDRDRARLMAVVLGVALIWIGGQQLLDSGTSPTPTTGVQSTGQG
jgi:hypothetical protein